MPSYANFDTQQFNCLDPNVTFTADFWKEWQTVQSLLERAQYNRDALRAQESSSAAGAIDEIALFAKQLVLDENTRKAKASALIERLRGKMQNYPSIPLQQEKRQLCLEFISLYSKLDTDLVKKDLASVLEGQAAIANERSVLDGKIGGYTRRLNTHLAKWQGCFKGMDVPDSYLGELAPTQPQQRREFALRIINDFVSLWKQRSRYYEIPVTVFGMAINSIADKGTRDIWTTAYNTLEMNKLPKALGRYQARLASPVMV